jgi:carbamoyltransferase
MIQWGINALNHGSSLAVFVEADLQYWIKSTKDELPSDVKKRALDFGSPTDVYWYERPWVKKMRQLRAGQYSTAMDLSVLPSRYLNRERLSWPKLHYTPHHASHAAAGYYTSPFDQSAVVVLDAIGEFECASIWHGQGDKLCKVWSRSYPHSLGLFYSAFTKLISLEPIKQEHLLQQMASNGDPERFYPTVREYVNGIVSLTRNLHRGVLDWPCKIDRLQDQCDIAAAVQRVFEEQVSLVMTTAKTLTNSDSLVYMGGCAMNSRANQQVSNNWKHIWSLPDPGDGASSIGAVLYHTRQRQSRYRWDPVKHIAIKV